MLKAIKPSLIPRSKLNTGRPTTEITSTPAVVKYEIHEFSRDKIATGEIDPTVINPYKYEEYPRNGNGQLTIDLNKDVTFNRYMINLQISKFEDAKFNEVVDIEFEEFLPVVPPPALPKNALLNAIDQFKANNTNNTFVNKAIKR